MTCEHLDFTANVRVDRIRKVEDGPIVAFSANVTINCAACGAPFRWLGLPAGSSGAVPLTDVAGFELRAPIAPKDEETDTHLLGYKVIMRGAQ